MLTDPRTPARRTAPSGPVVLALFLFSGMSGLIYEVVWSRLFSTVLGTTVYAVATVLAVFMGGLALGSWVFGRVADRPGANGLRIYGWLELVIGAFALALPLLMRLSNHVYQLVWPLVSESFALLMFVRVGLAVLVLIVPATMMGGTLPVLSRYLVRSTETGGREIGLLYAANTLGAVGGVLLTGFFLLERLGIARTLATGAVVSTAVGLVAIVWSRRLQAGDGADSPAAEPTPAAAPRRATGAAQVALWVFALSGVAALALEVLWTRSLAYFVSVDTWAFSSMLAAFLLGIGLGSFAMAPLVPRLRRPLATLGLLQSLIGLSAAASVPLFRLLNELWLSARAATEVSSVYGHMFQKLACSTAIMLVPTLLMGASFPVVSRIYVGARGAVGQGLGTLYALNTVGAILGSLLAGFVLIPLLGIQRGILAASSLYLVGGAVLFASDGARTVGRVVLPACALAAVALVNWLVPTRSIIEQSHHFLSDHGAEQRRLLWVDEGVGASIAIFDEGDGTTRHLTINGIVTAVDNYMDMQVHRMLSHLPMLLHPEPKRALVVGFGMGSTAYGCCQHEVERVDVVELLRAEKQAAPYFEHINHGVLEDPKLRFIVGDGRNYLLGTSERYDVISFNAVHPRFSANLYTRDFYELCRERMTEDGVLCAWFTQNSITDEEWRGLCGSLVGVFPHTSLWYSNPEHYCLIASKTELRPDFAEWARRMGRPAVAADLSDSNLADPFVLATRYLLGTRALREYVEGAPINTDDLARIEFSREIQGLAFDIAADLIERKEPATSLFATEDAPTRERLAALEESTLWMMRGQNQYWYRAGLREDLMRDEVFFKRAVAAAPENQDARHDLGFSRIVRERVEAQVRAAPDAPGPSLALARILREEARLAEAEQLLLRVLAAPAAPPEARIELGVVRYLRGDMAGCVDVFSSFGVDPEKAPRFAAMQAFALGSALRSIGNAASGDPLIERAHAIVPAIGDWFEASARQVEALTRVP